MTPQKKKALLFLLLMIGVSLGVVTWSVWANRGTLIIAGEAPFSINSGGLKNIVCQTAPCSVSLKPGQHNLAGKKEGFFDERFSAEVKLWKKIEIRLDFQFIPDFQEKGVYTPHEKLKRFEGNGLDFSPSFRWDDIDLSKIPNGAKKVLFSPSGRNAVVALGKEIYLFTQEEGKEAFLVALDVPYFDQVAFTASEQMLLLTGLNEKNPEETQRLLLVNPKNPNQRTVIGAFEKPIERPLLYAAKDRAMLIEQTAKGQRIYEISLVQKQKWRLELPETATNIRLLNDQWMAYEEKNGVFLRSLADNKEKNIAALSARHVLMINDGRILFVGAQSGETPITAEVSFEEFADMAAENLEALKNPKLNATGAKLKWYFVQMDAKNGFDQMALKDLAVMNHASNENLEIFPLQSSAEYIDFIKRSERETKIIRLQLKNQS